MKVQDADPWKRLIHATLRSTINAIGDPEEIRRDLAAAPDLVTRFLIGVVETTAEKVQREYQRETILTGGRFVVWWLDKDAAYRQARDAGLRYIAERADHVLRITPNASPEDWWVNRWGRSEAEAEFSRAVGSVAPDAVTLQEAAHWSQPPPEDADAF